MKQNINFYKLRKKSINLVDVKININKNINRISKKSNPFIKESFEIGLKLIKKLGSNKLINGPISKKYFLNKKYPGMTEYLAEKNNSKKFAMLIYNKKLSVCPLTTHVPIKKVSKYITKKNLSEKVKLINNFYIKYRKIKPKVILIASYSNKVFIGVRT